MHFLFSNVVATSRGKATKILSGIRDNRIKGQEMTSFSLYYLKTPRVSGVQLYGYSIDGFWFKSQYVSHDTACVCVLLENGACIMIFLLKNYTLEIQIHITKEHYFKIFVVFETIRNNKCATMNFFRKLIISQRYHCCKQYNSNF